MPDRHAIGFVECRYDRHGRGDAAGEEHDLPDMKRHEIDVLGHEHEQAEERDEVPRVEQAETAYDGELHEAQRTACH